MDINNIDAQSFINKILYVSIYYDHHSHYQISICITNIQNGNIALFVTCV